MKEVDVVCGMEFEVESSTPCSVRNGKQYRFCSTGCLQKFDAEPRRYTRKRGLLTRLVDWLARENGKQFGNKPPSCHG